MPPFTHRKALLLLIFSHLSVDMYGSFLAPLQPYLISKHQLTLAAAGFLVSLYSISASLLQPLYGFLSDRIGKRFFVMFAPLVASIFMSLLALAPSHFLLMTSLFVGGIGVAAFHPQASTLSHSVSGNRKGLGMSLFISGGNIGSAIGPLCIIFFVNRFGMDSTYVIALPGILLSAFLFLYCPQLPQQTVIPRLRDVFDGLKKWSRQLGSLYTIVVLRTFVQLSFLTFVPVLLSRMNLPPFYIGLAVTCFTGFGALGGLMGGFLYDRTGGRNLFLISSVASPLFLSLAVNFHQPILIISSVALGGFFVMMTIPISVLMGQSIVPNAISTISSLMMGFGWGAGGMLVPLTGRIADITSIHQTLGYVALIPFIYGIVAWRLPKKVSSLVTV